MKLYSYFRSSASHRVRIALAYKGIEYSYAAIHLVKGGGDQRRPEFTAVNPQAQVPVLEIEEGGQRHRLTQSLAILEYLEETHPTPPLLPENPLLRARARQIAEIVNSGIQPLQNLFVLKRLQEEFGVDRKRWAQPFIQTGLAAVEALAGEAQGPFLAGEHPSFAEVCLVPQLHAARRFDVELAAYPRCLAIEATCAKLPAFEAARPDRQPDAEA